MNRQLNETRNNFLHSALFYAMYIAYFQISVSFTDSLLSFQNSNSPFWIISASLFPQPNFSTSFISAQISYSITSLLPFLALGLVPYYSKLHPHTQTMKVFVFCQVIPENHLFHKSISHYINGRYPKDKELECWCGFVM